MPESHRPNILYVVHRVPHPLDKGERIRAFSVLKYLSQKAAVHLACLADEPVADETGRTLSGLCKRLAIVSLGRRSRWFRAASSLARGHTVTEGAFQSAELRDILRSWARGIRFQAVLASASSLVPYLQLDELRDVPAVVDLADVDSQKWFDYAAASRWPLSWLFRTEGGRLRELERRLPASTRAVTLVSEAEARLYRQFCSAGSVHAVPLGVDLDYYQPRPGAIESGCVFVGALDYRPNVDAVVWFCRVIWPEIHVRRPATKMVLIGRRPVRSVRQLGRLPGVEVFGPVPDVRPYLARAAVVVAPLRIARGVQNKVLEALAMGKAVIGSPQCLVGLETQPGVHIEVASSPAEWTERVTQLLDSKARRIQLGMAGREFVETHHRWERCLASFEQLLGLSACLVRPAEEREDLCNPPLKRSA